MSENKLKETAKPQNPLRSKWLILIGVLALLNILFLLIPGGIDLISIITHSSRRITHTIGTFWFPYLGSIALSALMLFVIALGGFLRQNVLCAIGTLGYGLVYPLSIVINRINGEIAATDMVYGPSYFSMLSRIIPQHFRRMSFFQFYCYPGLFFLSIGMILLSVLFFLRSGNSGGKGLKIVGIMIAVFSIMILAISGLSYSSTRVLNEYWLPRSFVRRFIGLAYITRPMQYYSEMLSRLLQGLFRSPTLPSVFLAVDIIFNAIRIFSSFVMFTAMGIIGAVTIPAKKTEKNS